MPIISALLANFSQALWIKRHVLSIMRIIGLYIEKYLYVLTSGQLNYLFLERVVISKIHRVNQIFGYQTPIFR